MTRITTADLTCQNCGEPNDAATSPDNPDLSPDVDDLNVCYKCGYVSAYTKKGEVLGFRPLTAEEAAEVEKDQDLQDFIAQRKRRLREALAQADLEGGE